MRRAGSLTCPKPWVPVRTLYRLDWMLAKWRLGDRRPCPPIAKASARARFLASPISEIPCIGNGPAPLLAQFSAVHMLVHILALAPERIATDLLSWSTS